LLSDHPIEEPERRQRCKHTGVIGSPDDRPHLFPRQMTCDRKADIHDLHARPHAEHQVRPEWPHERARRVDPLDTGRVRLRLDRIAQRLERARRLRRFALYTDLGQARARLELQKSLLLLTERELVLTLVVPVPKLERLWRQTQKAASCTPEYCRYRAAKIHVQG